MQLHIRHETFYRYGEPVKRSVQNLRLTPRRDPMQRALSWNMAAPGRYRSQVDAYGNIVHLLTLDEPHREIRIVVNGIVEIDDDSSMSLPDEGKISPLAFLAETPLTRADEAIANFARPHLQAGDNSPDRLLTLAEAVCEEVRYEKGATDVHESASRAFARGAGVCQDHSHIYIACCRSAGIPARYVSGYFYAGKEGEIASHAWVDVWAGRDQGWKSIDVTHRTPTDGRHCRLAVGRDYLDACPVRGVRRGGGTEEMQVAVRIATAAQQ
ncbi:transglutaminase family protein [Peristeroidobacter soli]|jgi:transglutaminase-like putative cysteine protease|uniref:transglutaminase family protein n=1 Tax=Peristeroidobacter soli TaxID=2497877 RepID=UPI00101D91D5|nr:transglutaminase family protein [Peristeroidobacter soli]